MNTIHQKTYRALLFDLDGVLIDSTECIIRHWRQWAQDHDLNLGSILEVAYGIPTIQTIQQVAPHLDAKEETRKFTELELADTEDVLAINGAPELLGQLPGDTWGIVTSANRDLAEVRLEHVGLPIPKVLVSSDDVNSGKPSPEPYLLAMEKFGLTPDKCIVLEDSPSGIQAANNAGTEVIAVASTHKKHELIHADWILDKLLELQVAVMRDDDQGWQLQIRGTTSKEE